MSSKHITRDYSAHRRNVIRPTGEYCGLEIFSFDPEYTQFYIRENNTLQGGDNSKNASWRSWACYTCSDKSYDMTLSVDYRVMEKGEYRVDFLYEQNSNLYSNQNLTGGITIIKDDSIIYDDDTVLFDGEDNFIKRIPVYLDLDTGLHSISVDVPPNCYFYGIIVRKVVKYTANNYFGADAGKDSGNMMFTDATLTISNMVKPSELVVTVAYDDEYECDYSPSGFYIDFMDEVNFYVKNNDGEVERVFGGYVSSILPNADRTELSIHCADRLVDGQNKYVLDYFTFQGGKEVTNNKLRKDFKNYAHILKYLCDAHEVTLQSNISENYLVEGEKYNNGFTITYGSNKDISKIPVTNGYSSTSNNHVTLRNKPDGSKKQVWTLYNASKHSKVAPNITDKPYIHITYGLGSPKTNHDSKTTSTVDTSDTTAGVQKFGKCGQSKDGKYLMAIGKVSGSKGGSLSRTAIYKTIFENKCPRCGKPLVWDAGREGTNCVRCGGYKGSKRTWGNISETEITCTGCCSDYDAVTGYEKINNPKYHIKKVTSPVKSSKAEQDTLFKGEMKAVPKTGVKINPDEIFEAISKEAFKYSYKRGATGQTYNQMKKTGHGDCHGFSDLIFTMLKKYGVTCKVVSYSTGASDSHHSVLYKDSKNQWQDFPYKKYGWDKKYKNKLNATSKSKTGSKVNNYTGHNIGQVTVGSKKTTKTETTKITTTKGYDSSKPFNGYLKITYSNSNSLSAPKKTLYLRFTQRYTKGDSINQEGFPLYWVNNHTKKSTFLDKNGKSLNLVEWIRQAHGSQEEVYLQSIHMITAPKVVTDSSKDSDWYTYNKTTHDESSCKMDLYQITFDADKGTNPDDIQSCGKTVNSMLQEITKDTDYLAYMEYGLHRKDDQIHFRVNNTRETSFTASEGNDNNILSWNSISYSPISSLYNMSIQVYKPDEVYTDKYAYVDSRYPDSILRYGEQAILETSNEPISNMEAYFNARMNEKFNGEQTYSYTITVPNKPKLRLGEFVKVIANAKKLNTIKTVKSLKITFKWTNMPRIQTEIGLDELAPDLQLRENIRNLRRETKKEDTSFSSSATPISDPTIYEWDR